MQIAQYGEFSEKVHELVGGKRVPMEVSIEVTRRCPLECQHCYNNLAMSDSVARASEMTFEEHCRLLDELVDMGCLWLLYTGGEIFGRKDFLDIYTEAKKRGFLITLFTNGTLITPRIADHLVTWRPFAIEITLYGATRETYEAMTQVRGSYDRCMRGIRLLADRGLPLKLKTVPTTINQHEVYEMKRMAEEDFGVEFKFDALINPRIDCSQSPLNVRLTPEEVVGLEFVDARRKDDYRRLAERDFAAPKGPQERNNHKYFCGGGMGGCAIDPTGTMSICVISHQQGYNMRKGSFREGWEGPLREIRLQPKTRPNICDRCGIQSLCSMCPANGELENGDQESPVQFLCEVAHLRAYTLGFDVPEHGADCLYCAGREKHSEVLAAAERLRALKSVDSWQSNLKTQSLLKILQPASTCHPGGGCSSCA